MSETNYCQSGDQPFEERFAFWCGGGSPTTAPFSVTKDGDVFARRIHLADDDGGGGTPQGTTTRKVHVTYSKSKQSVTRTLYQHDYGQVLVFDGDNFPDMGEFHFQNEGDTKTTVVFGSNSRVLIPDKYLKTGKNIIVYAYSHVRACDGESVYKVLIPVEQRSLIGKEDSQTPVSNPPAEAVAE